MTRRTVSITALGVLLLAWSGCSGTKQTEYVAGISTQVRVPRDLKTVRVDVFTSPGGGSGEVNQFCRLYQVYNGVVQLPRSFGSFRSQGSTSTDPVTFTISGYTYDIEAPELVSAQNDCAGTPAKVTAGGAPLPEDMGAGNARILRRSRQPYVTDRVLYLPMPLKYACYDVPCGDGTSCKGGTCLPEDITDPAHTLKDFSDELADGTGGACFHASDCMAIGEPPVVVSTDDCTFALPNTNSAPASDAGITNPVGPPPGQPWDGLNVQAVFDGGANAEILDLDQNEGFFIPDPSKPQEFRLAAGLCAMWKGGLDDSGAALTPHRITALRASGTCQPKTLDQPICAGDQLAAMGADPNGSVASVPPSDAICAPQQLQPARAALEILADDSANSETFYVTDTMGEPASSAALNLSLADPAFNSTAIGLAYFPGAVACNAQHLPTDPMNVTSGVVIDRASTTQPKIAASFKLRPGDMTGTALSPRNAADNLEGALHDAYNLLATGADGKSRPYSSYYRRAVVVLGNRGFTGNACYTAPIAQATAASSAAAPIKTYVVVLANNHDGGAQTDFFADANALAVAGGTAHAYDGRTNKQNALQAFLDIEHDLASCAYDVDPPAKPPVPGDVLSYTDPLTGNTTVVKYDASCKDDASASTANGWGIDAAVPTRVRICGTNPGGACDAYHTVAATAAQYAAINRQPALAVPMFAHHAACAPTTGVPGSPAGGGMSSSGGAADASTPNPDAGSADGGTKLDAGP